MAKRKNPSADPERQFTVIGAPDAPSLSFRDLFLSLTRYTTPHGSEPYLWDYIPGPGEWDSENNFIVRIPKADGSDSRVMFSCHLDNACPDMQYVTHMEDGTGLIKTDGTTILGADCKIGAALMIKMIEAGVPGTYVFHAGEECGCIGSRHLAAELIADWNEGDPYPFDYCIAFDRYGYQSVITHQGFSRCCSDEFAQALASALNETEGLNFGLDEGGVYTDSAEYVDIIPECTNLSVGYFAQHTTGECQDLSFAEVLLGALLKIDWESLPVKRDPEKPEPGGWYGTGPARSRYSFPPSEAPSVSSLGVDDDDVPFEWDEDDNNPYRMVSYTCIHCGTPDRAYLWEVEEFGEICATCFNLMKCDPPADYGVPTKGGK